MEVVLCLFYFVYVFIALTPALVIFTLHVVAFTFLNFAYVVLGSIVCAMLSYIYMYLIERYMKPSDKMSAVEMVEIAEPKYIPVYIAYFVIAVSIEDWKIFMVVFLLIYFLILKGKFSYFNPYLLFFRYHFYEVSIDPNKIEGGSDPHTYAKFKVFLISKRGMLKIETHFKELIRLNDFVFLDKKKE
ncbi:hypothetical protein [Helicobacter suis]|uniref:hypothetical protein n=1 Tax=Helicobacter suis TaxID=104628 RepID=UPI0013D07CB0|nr:hypothetical protein [Helicobacter suis]